MKIKELTTIGFKPTPKKDYYYYIQDFTTGITSS